MVSTACQLLDSLLSFFSCSRRELVHFAGTYCQGSLQRLACNHKSVLGREKLLDCWHQANMYVSRKMRNLRDAHHGRRVGRGGSCGGVTDSTYLISCSRLWHAAMKAKRCCTDASFWVASFLWTSATSSASAACSAAMAALSASSARLCKQTWLHQVERLCLQITDMQMFPLNHTCA